MIARVVVAWVTEQEVNAFMEAWGEWDDSLVVFQHDEHREGCGATKNKGVKRAIELGSDVVVVLDGDCYPSEEAPTLEALIDKHLDALEPAKVHLYRTVTDPPSRGTPYRETTVTMSVAASMGYWLNVPDYCAVRQLAHDAKPMTFDRGTVYQRYFPLCGMNLAFRPKDWWPWCQFIEVSRFDDIWQGWLWQKEAFRRGYCFNLGGPLITHARQSNVWKNLRDETIHLEATETLWRDIATSPTYDYGELLKLLPTGTGLLDRKFPERWR